MALIRVSTDAGRQELGATGQRKAIERWAAENGVTVVAWHLEEVSGGAAFDRRPVLHAALDDVATHGAGLFVVQKIDRFSRDPLSAGMALAVLAKTGATLATTDGAGAGDDDASVLMRDMLLAFGRFDKNYNVRRRIQAALDVKRERGETCGHPPYGYRAEVQERLGKRVKVNVPDEAEQATLATLRALRASGLSLQTVADEARLQGIVSRSGRPFHVSGIALLVAEESKEKAA